MEIRSLDNAWTFTLSVTDTETEQLPSVGVVIALDGEFSTKKSSVWYEYNEITDFVAALHRLDESRGGEASLDSMSPSECSIRVECVGALGNVLLHFNINRVTYFPEAQGHAKNAIVVTFEVNRESIHGIISDFSELATVCRPSPHAR